MPFPDSDRLVRIFTLPPGLSEARQRNPLHSLDFVRFRERSHTLDGLEVIWPRDRSLTGAGDPVIVKAGSVSAGFFAILGGRPELGRVFTPDEDVDGNGLVVLSHGAWKRLFGGDPAAIGRTMSIDGAPHVVLGVMGPDFQPAYVDTELWTPLGANASHLPQPNATFSVSVGRLAAGGLAKPRRRNRRPARSRTPSGGWKRRVGPAAGVQAPETSPRRLPAQSVPCRSRRCRPQERPSPRSR